MEMMPPTTLIGRREGHIYHDFYIRNAVMERGWIVGDHVIRCSGENIPEKSRYEKWNYFTTHNLNHPWVCPVCRDLVIAQLELKTLTEDH